MIKYSIYLIIKILGYIPIAIVVIFGLLNWTNNQLIVSVNNFIHSIQGILISFSFYLVMREISINFNNADLKKTNKGSIKKFIRIAILIIIGIILISLNINSTDIAFIIKINRLFTETDEGTFILIIAIVIFFELLEPVGKVENQE